MVSVSEELDKLTQVALDICIRLEEIAEEFEILIKHLYFYVRQTYNAAKYKMDTSANALRFGYFGDALYY